MWRCGDGETALSVGVAIQAHAATTDNQCFRSRGTCSVHKDLSSVGTCRHPVAPRSAAQPDHNYRMMEAQFDLVREREEAHDASIEPSDSSYPAMRDVLDR